MNQASLLGCVSLGAECRKVLMLVVCFVLNETKLTSNGIHWNADVNAAWNILVKNNKNVSSTLDRNEVERFVVDPVVLIPAGFNRDKNDTASGKSGCGVTENRHELDLVPDHLS